MRFKRNLSDLNHAVTDAKTVKDLRRGVVAFAKALGFDTVSATAVFDRPNAPPDFYSVDNTPSAYLECWDDRNLGRLDPVMQHCKRSCQPIVWDQRTYVATGMGVLWEQQARYGYRHGIAMAIHGVGGRHLFLGVDRDRPIDEPAQVVAQMTSALSVFASHLESVAYRIFDPNSEQVTPLSSLTGDEIEVLKRSLDGSLTAEVAQMMNISTETATSHLTGAMRKLQCSTRYHAVIKAIRLGLIRP